MLVWLVNECKVGLTDFGFVGPFYCECFSHENCISLSRAKLQTLLEVGTQRVYWRATEWGRGVGQQAESVCVCCMHVNCVCVCVCIGSVAPRKHFTP